MDNKGLNLIQKRSYHLTDLNRCHWRNLLNKIGSGEVKITNIKQFVKLDLDVNKTLFEKNKKDFYKLYENEVINSNQLKLLLNNNKKTLLAFEHPGWIYKDPKKGFKIHFNDETIEKGDISAFNNAKYVKFIELDGEYYARIIYKLCNEENVKLFKFILYKDIDLKNISKFEKKFILHKDDFKLLDVSKFFNNSSLLHNLCIQNSNTLNHLIKKNEN